MITRNDNASKPKQGRKSLAALLLSVTVLVTVSASGLLTPQPARAIPTEVVASVPDAKDDVTDIITNTLVEAAVSSVVNGVNYFATQMAYQAAVALTTSCPGQTICWNSKSFKQGFQESWQGAVGEAVGTLSDETGLTKLGFDLCNPGIDITLKIQLGLLNQVKPKPRCDYNAIVSNWDNLSQSVTSGRALNAMKPVFTQGQSPLSVSLGVFDNVYVQEQNAKINASIKEITDAAAGGGFSPVTDPVTGRVKSPAFVTQQQYEQMNDAQKKEAPARISQLSAGQIASRAVTTVVLNTVQTFTQTLVAGLWNKLANGLLSTEELIANQPDLVLNPDALLTPGGVVAQEQIQAVRNRAATTRDTGLIDPLLDFSSCPSTNRSAKNCVIDQQFANAVRVADATPFTVRTAMEQGMLHGDWPLIPASDVARNQDPYCYTQGYCESNLKKLRAARIIPIGWEIAASESNGRTTLKAVVDGFNDCNDQGTKDAQHPYCRLIDPDWVLRAPLAQCRALGYGEQLVSSAIPTRSEVCLDTQTCLKQDENGNCIGGWGYCTKEQNIWRFNADSCPAQYNTCRVLKGRDGTTNSYNVNTIDHGVCNADNVGCRQYATVATADAWLPNPARYFNARAQSCEASAAGCTSLVRLGNQQALNLIRNGGFDEVEDGDLDGNVDHARYWSPFGGVAPGQFGSLLRDGSKSVSGDNAILIGGSAPYGSVSATPGAVCTLAGSQTCNNSGGCNCNHGSAGYGCAVPFGGTSCSVTNRVLQDGLRLSRNKTYTLSFSVMPVTGSAAAATAIIHTYDANRSGIDLTAANTPNTESVSGAANGASVDCSVGASGGTSGDLLLSVSGTQLNPNQPITATCTFVMTSGNIAGASIELRANGTASAYVDNVQLEEGGGSPFHEGYGDTLGNVNAKIAPDYLNCTGEATDAPECANYAGVCRESELGCEAYSPTNGDPVVPGIISQQDLCPASCAGYDVFKQEPSEFERSNNIRVNFIPSTAAVCSAADVGCSEFTNVATEQRAYYSSLRLCVQPEDPSVGTYYSWEGSDTTGYQLRNWTLKNTTNASGAVAAVANGGAAATASDVCANAGCANAGPAPCTKLDGNALHCASRNTQLTSGSTDGYCSRADIDAGNLDCREFYDALGNRHYRLYSRTIVASATCDAYRITVSTQSDCTSSNGRWIAAQGQCIYNADASLSASCGQAENGCRAYKGNASTNVRTVLSDDFESGVGNWKDNTDSTSNGLTQSAESILVGGHSIKLTYSSGEANNRYMTTEVGGTVAPNRSYSLTFWARGTGTVASVFRTGRVATPSLPLPNPVIGTVPFPPNFVVLGNEWKQYSVGPVFATGNGYANGTIRLSLQARGVCVGGTNAGIACTANSNCGGGGTCAQSDVYIDNVQLREVQDSIYVIRDSWNTPIACDQNSSGVAQPQAMLGCREYKKSDGSSVYLKSFSRLCREQAIGCSAYSDTRSTPQNPYAETYNAVCRLPAVCGQNGTTVTGATCACNYNLNHPATQASAPQMLSDVCRVNIGESECRFNLDRVDDATPAASYPDRVVVDGDRRMYLVVKEKDFCSASDVGCTLMGQAVESFEQTCTNRDSSGTAIRCESGSGCNCTVGGATCRVSPGASTCTIPLEQPRIAEWRATAIKDLPADYGNILCRQEAVACEAFSSSDGVQYFKDPGNRVCEYKESVSYQGRTVSGWFRKSATGGVFPCYPELLREGSTYEMYKNADSTCRLNSVCTAAGGCNCPVSGATVCRVPQGGTTCGYQGWVGVCQPQYDRCEEFVDPISTSEANPNGQPYYYLANSKLDRQSCAGSASLKQGCVMFKQTSVTANLYSAATTYFRSQRDNQNNKIAPVNCALNSADPSCRNRCASIPVGQCSNETGRSCHSNSDCRNGGTCNGTVRYTTACLSDSDCNRGIGETCRTTGIPASELGNDSNVVIKVSPDRQCAEWLSCSATDQVWDESRNQFRSVCIGFTPCTQNSGTGNNPECAVSVETAPKVFTREDYSKRDVSWGGLEYSGYSIIDAYPSNFLTPLNVVQGVCVEPDNDVILGSNGRSITCDVNADCSAVGSRCRKLSGICVGAGIAYDGRSCNNSGDCGGGSAVCSFSYLATHRFAVVLEPNRVCASSTDCRASVTGQAEDGTCVDHRCAYNFNGGGAFNATQADTAPRCRAYPESDAPYPSSVVDNRGSASGYDAYGGARSIKTAFSGANVCGMGNDCSCSYTRWKYGSSDTLFLTRPGNTENGPIVFANGAPQALSLTGNEGICVGGPNEGMRCVPPSSGRFTSGSNKTNDPCNSEGGGTCQRLTNVSYQQGWIGYCMDLDKSISISGDPSKFDCNLWLPVDQLIGAPDEFNQFQEAGYNPPLSQLMYCAAAQGNAFGTGSTPYNYRFVDEWSQSSSDFWAMSGGESDENRTTDVAYPSNRPPLFRDQLVALHVEVDPYCRDSNGDGAPFDMYLVPGNTANDTDFENILLWGQSSNFPSGGLKPQRARQEGVSCTRGQSNVNAGNAANCISIEAQFDANGRLTGFHNAIAHDNGETCEPSFNVRITALTRENCSEIVLTHDAGQGGTQNFGWTDKLFKLAMNPYGMQGAHTTTRRDIGNDNLTPYGRVEPSSLDTRNPLSVWSSEGGSPYTFVAPNPDAVEGEPAYFFDGPNTNRAGDPFVDAAGYPFACKGPCAHGPSSNLGGNASDIGNARISELFAWSFARYLYDDSPTRRVPVSNPYSTSPGVDRREDYTTSGDAPRVVAVNRANCAPGSDGLCEEGVYDPTGRSGLTVGNSMGGQAVVSQDPGKYRATISFYAYADENRMPIRRKIVDFGDGSQMSVSGNPSYFKNHRGCTPGGTCGTGNTVICSAGNEWGKTEDSCEPAYFQSTHLYKCTPEMLTLPTDRGGIPACNSANPRFPCKAPNPQTGDMACHFKPRVQILDNWGFCNGTCTGAPGGSSCFNRGGALSDSLVTRINAIYDHGKGDLFGSAPNNECTIQVGGDYSGTWSAGVNQKPWTEFGNVIIVSP